MDVLTDPIPAGFDCVLCAGVLVFLPEDSQLRIRNRLVDSLPDEGFLMLEHTQPPYPGEIAGRIVHRFYHDHPELNVRGHVEVENYAITLFQKASM
jgi:hypothetical protein